MFKKIFAGALSLSCIAAHSTDATLNVTPEQGKELSCYIVADDFVVYELYALQNKDNDYDYFD